MATSQRGGRPSGPAPTTQRPARPVRPAPPVAPPRAELAELRALVADILRAVGALVEEAPDGLLDVLVPDEHQARLGGAFLRLAFDPDLAAAHPDAQHVVVGSPLTEAIVALGQAQGVTARWHVHGLRWSRRQAISLDRWRAKLVNARFLPATGVELAFASHHLLLSYRVAYISDEKREELRTVVVDVGSLQPAPLLQAAWEQLPDDAGDLWPLPEELRPAGATWQAVVALAAQPELSLADGDRLPDAGQLAALCQRAGELLEAQLGGALATYRRRAARRLEMERLRLETYYDDVSAELEKRLARAESDERRHSLEAKLTANRLERERKLADAVAKHRLRVVATLLSGAIITQPKVRTYVRIENRYAATDLAVVLNPLTGQLELPTCHACHGATASVHLCANGHLACDDCALPCAFCQREHCRECGVATCAVCGRAACPTHAVRCPTCGRVTCPEDRGKCHAA